MIQKLFASNTPAFTAIFRNSVKALHVFPVKKGVSWLVSGKVSLRIGTDMRKHAGCV